jgi:hypothetical protein
MIEQLFHVVEYKHIPGNPAVNEGTGTDAGPKSQWQRVRGTGSLVSFTAEAAQKIADDLALQAPGDGTPRRFEVRPFVRLPEPDEPIQEDL